MIFFLDFPQWNVESATSTPIHIFSPNQIKALIEICTSTLFSLLYFGYLPLKRNFIRNFNRFLNLDKFILYRPNNPSSIDDASWNISRTNCDSVLNGFGYSIRKRYGTWIIMDKIIILRLRKQPENKSLLSSDCSLQFLKTLQNIVRRKSY